MKYICRAVAPMQNESRLVEASTPEEAVQEYHYHSTVGATASVPNGRGGTARIVFNRIEVDGHGDYIVWTKLHGIWRGDPAVQWPTLRAIVDACSTSEDQVRAVVLHAGGTT